MVRCPLFRPVCLKSPSTTQFLHGAGSMGSVGETWLDKATLYGEGATPHRKFCVAHRSMCKRDWCTDHALCIALVVLTLRHGQYTHTETHTDTHWDTHRHTQRHTDTHRDTHRHTLFVLRVWRFSVGSRKSVTVSPSEEVPLATYSGVKEKLIPEEASDACVCEIGRASCRERV